MHSVYCPRPYLCAFRFPCTVNWMSASSIGHIDEEKGEGTDVGVFCIVRQTLIYEMNGIMYSFLLFCIFPISFRLRLLLHLQRTHYYYENGWSKRRIADESPRKICRWGPWCIVSIVGNDSSTPRTLVEDVSLQTTRIFISICNEIFENIFFFTFVKTTKITILWIKMSWNASALRHFKTKAILRDQIDWVISWTWELSSSVFIAFDGQFAPQVWHTD